VFYYYERNCEKSERVRCWHVLLQLLTFSKGGHINAKRREERGVGYQWKEGEKRNLLWRAPFPYFSTEEADPRVADENQDLSSTKVLCNPKESDKS
jgi:hypothetical protein